MNLRHSASYAVARRGLCSPRRQGHEAQRKRGRRSNGHRFATSTESRALSSGRKLSHGFSYRSMPSPWLPLRNPANQFKRTRKHAGKICMMHCTIFCNIFLSDSVPFSIFLTQVLALFALKREISVFAYRRFFGGRAFVIGRKQSRPILAAMRRAGSPPSEMRRAVPWRLESSTKRA